MENYEMIKLENCEVMGWEHAIRGMRNPMNSWKKSDSFWTNGYVDDDHFTVQHAGCYEEFQLGPNDTSLMSKLANGGPVHAKYRRMIVVYVDITAPLYWWKEFDTYKVGTVANSCSTMHKIHEKSLTLDDFSHEHLDDISISNLLSTIDVINDARHKFKSIEGKGNKKYYWWQMIQLLPSSYNQKRTIMFNYEVLANIYASRKNHKLDEWLFFCDWIENLPFSDIITKKELDNQ